MSDSLSPPDGVLAEIEEIAGREAAIGVALNLGGQWVHFPTRQYVETHPGHWLPSLLGRDIGARIADRLCGNSLRIPMARAWVARCLAASGEDISEIARRLGTERSNVRRYLKPVRKP